MLRTLRYILLATVLAFSASEVFSQAADIRGLHKVKKKETVYGIARMYDLSEAQLIDANPEMKSPDFKLKKGTILRIPFPKTETAAPVVAAPVVEKHPANEFQKRPIRLGVMLPLHNVNGDGRRMTEYYRGVLMACDSLRKLGISVDVHAWNTAEDGNISEALNDPAAARCDLIIGPLYSKQMAQLSAFVEKHDIRLVIPFSINAPQLTTNRLITQIWQSPNDINEATIRHFIEHFRSYHPVIIDCNDSTSQKGAFTSGLRRQLEQQSIAYDITNLKSGEDAFARAFSRTKRNVVILNTGRSKELGVAFAKISGMTHTESDIRVTMFGYTDWLSYTRSYLDNYYKFDTYIPSVFHYNPTSPATQRMQQKYRWNFHADMQSTLPRFALTGFDHAYYFLRGMHKYGRDFNGEDSRLGIVPVQTPLKLERYAGGGLRNRQLLFIHYTPAQLVETIKL